MQRWLLALGLLLAGSAGAHSFTLSVSGKDAVTTPLFSDVTTLEVENVDDLAPGTPSGFARFALQRAIDPRTLTRFTEPAQAPPASVPIGSSSGGGAVSLVFFAVLWLLVVHAAMRRRWAISRT